MKKRQSSFSSLSKGEVESESVLESALVGGGDAEDDRF